MNTVSFAQNPLWSSKILNREDGPKANHPLTPKAYDRATFGMASDNRTGVQQQIDEILQADESDAWKQLNLIITLKSALGSRGEEEIGYVISALQKMEAERPKFQTRIGFIPLFYGDKGKLLKIIQNLAFNPRQPIINPREDQSSAPNTLIRLCLDLKLDDDFWEVLQAGHFKLINELPDKAEHCQKALEIALTKPDWELNSTPEARRHILHTLLQHAFNAKQPFQLEILEQICTTIDPILDDDLFRKKYLYAYGDTSINENSTKTYYGLLLDALKTRIEDSNYLDSLILDRKALRTYAAFIKTFSKDETTEERAGALLATLQALPEPSAMQKNVAEMIREVRATDSPEIHNAFSDRIFTLLKEALSQENVDEINFLLIAQGSFGYWTDNSQYPLHLFWKIFQTKGQLPDLTDEIKTQIKRLIAHPDFEPNYYDLENGVAAFQQNPAGVYILQCLTEEPHFRWESPEWRPDRNVRAVNKFFDHSNKGWDQAARAEMFEILLTNLPEMPEILIAPGEENYSPLCSALWNSDWAVLQHDTPRKMLPSHADDLTSRGKMTYLKLLVFIIQNEIQNTYQGQINKIPAEHRRLYMDYLIKMSQHSRDDQAKGQASKLLAELQKTIPETLATAPETDIE